MMSFCTISTNNSLSSHISLYCLLFATETFHRSSLPASTATSSTAKTTTSSSVSSSSSSSTDVDPTVSTTPHPLTLTHLQATASISVIDLLVQLLPTEATTSATAAAASSSSLSSVRTAYHHLHSTLHLLSKASEPGLASANAQAPGLGVGPGRDTMSSVVSFSSKEVMMIVDAVDDATRKVKRWRNEVIEDMNLHASGPGLGQGSEPGLGLMTGRVHASEPGTGLGQGKVSATATARDRGRRLVQGPGPAPTHGQGLGQGLGSRRGRAKRQWLELGVGVEEKEENDAGQISFSTRGEEPNEKNEDKDNDQQPGQGQGQGRWAKENEEDRQVTWRLCGVLSSIPTTSSTTASSSHYMMTGAISTQGYTCGLWSLLHFLTVASGQQQQQQGPGLTSATITVTTSGSNTTALTTTTTIINTVDVLGVIRSLVDQVGHHDKSTDDDNFTITINDTKDDDTPSIYTVQYISMSRPIRTPRLISTSLIIPGPVF